MKLNLTTIISEVVLKGFGRFLSEPNKKSPLVQELAGLTINIAETDAKLARLAKEFWANGGVCCPSCGVPGYSDLQLKQERRRERVKQVIAKLDRDSYKK